MGAGAFCRNVGMRRGVGRSVSGQSYVRGQPIRAGHSPSGQAEADSRAVIARFFIDLRQALRLTVPQAAYYLQVPPEVVEALETGRVEYLPPWPETSAIIMTYASMAGINGKPVISAIGTLLTHLSVAAAPAVHFPTAPALAQRQPAPRQLTQRVRDTRAVREPAPVPGGLATSSRNLLSAGSAIANGARRLPQQALNQMRQRPQRAVYAVSLPLGFLLLAMNSSIFATVSHPFSMAVQWVSTYFQEHYGPVRDGLRYIEVDNPETRRADKLRIGSGSY